jgi:outer membrane protein OmpA-like peptidoglycan-associated protein
MTLAATLAARMGLATGAFTLAVLSTLSPGLAADPPSAQRALELAQAQPLTEQEKAKHREQQKTQPQVPKGAPPTKGATTVPFEQKRIEQKHLEQTHPAALPKNTSPPVGRATTIEAPLQPGKPAIKKLGPALGEQTSPAPDKGTGPAHKGPLLQKGAAPLVPAGPSPQPLPQGQFKHPTGQITAPGMAPTTTPGTGFAPRTTISTPQHFQDIQKGRRERVEDGGKRIVIQEPGNRTIVRQDNRIVIRHDEGERFRRLGHDVRSERRPDGVVESFYVRPDGMRIITETGADGRVLRRYRRGQDGREYVLFDNRRFYRTGLAIGVGALALAVALSLPPLHVTIPPALYIVDYDHASDDDIYDALIAPPVEDLDRAYALDEVLENYPLRQRMRRIDLDTINFEFGAWEVTPDQYPKLERLAHALQHVLERNPDATFLVEGHTDAVGSDIDNLSLSDRRAQSVAEALSNGFGIPPENLVTQGYGSQFLKIDTPGPERRNRRAAIINISPLIADRR